MRPEKTTIVEDLSKRLNQSPFLIVTEYTGMNVLQFSELRSRLAGAGAQCRVVKNTFLRRAAAEVGYPDLADSLSGQTAIVTGESDVCAAAKILKGFSTEFQKPSVKNRSFGQSDYFQGADTCSRGFTGQSNLAIAAAGRSQIAVAKTGCLAQRTGRITGTLAPSTVGKRKRRRGCGGNRTDLDTC